MVRLRPSAALVLWPPAPAWFDDAGRPIGSGASVVPRDQPRSRLRLPPQAQIGGDCSDHNLSAFASMTRVTYGTSAANQRAQTPSGSRAQAIALSISRTSRPAIASHE